MSLASFLWPLAAAGFQQPCCRPHGIESPCATDGRRKKAIAKAASRIGATLCVYQGLKDTNQRSRVHGETAHTRPRAFRFWRRFTPSMRIGSAARWAREVEFRRRGAGVALFASKVGLGLHAIALVRGTGVWCILTPVVGAVRSAKKTRSTAIRRAELDRSRVGMARSRGAGGICSKRRAVKRSSRCCRAVAPVTATAARTCRQPEESPEE